MLARGKRFIAVQQLFQVHSLLPRPMVPFDRGLNCIQKILVAKRFGEELDRTSLHGLHRHWDVSMPGDEDDGYWSIVRGELVLKIEPTQTGKTHIRYKAARCVWALAFQELLCCSEGSDIQPDRAEQVLERLLYRNIVIDNKYDGPFRTHDKPLPSADCCSAFAAGRLNCTVSPGPSFNFAQIFPP